METKITLSTDVTLTASYVEETAPPSTGESPIIVPLILAALLMLTS